MFAISKWDLCKQQFSVAILPTQCRIRPDLMPSHTSVRQYWRQYDVSTHFTNCIVRSNTSSTIDKLYVSKVVLLKISLRTNENFDVFWKSIEISTTDKCINDSVLVCVCVVIRFSKHVGPMDTIFSCAFRPMMKMSIDWRNPETFSPKNIGDNWWRTVKVKVILYF